MDPDATLRSVEQTLRAARSNIFNFKHDGTYGCNLDENLLMKMLAGMNRKWPRIPYELGSVAMEHNLLFREQQALAMLPNDPDGAIHFMEAQIKLELEKDATLRVANPWRESLKKNATGDISLFSRMMEQLPDRHFEAVIDENLTVLNASAGLREIAIANSFKRPVEVRYMTLARLADNGLLKGTPQGQRAEAELLYLIGAPPQAGSWQTEVSRILD